MRTILLGPPGAGKGTQAAGLSQRLGVPHIATGDLFRQAQDRGTELGLLAKSYMEKGTLVPNEVTIRMVLERLEDADCQKGFVLDGFPRNLQQAKALDSALTKAKQKLDRVFYIKVSTEELVRRLSGRWICRTCQTPYHEVNSPPKVMGRCDKCSGELYQRPDDKEGTVRKRVQVYFNETAPLVEYYKASRKLVEINGEGAIKQVEADLAKATR